MPISENADQADHGFEIDPQEENFLTEVSRRICASLEHLSYDVPKVDRYKSFINSLRIIWPDNDGHRVKPRFKLAGFQDVSIKFEPYGVGGSHETANIAGREITDIVIGLRIAIDAQDPATFQHAIRQIAATIYHEVEHLFYHGADLEDDTTPEDAVKYLANPGEMRAHAKQFAYLYSQAFPDQDFDLDKMISICKTNKEINYFVTMADPMKQHKYAAIADLKFVHEKMVEMTAIFVKLLRSS